MLKTNKLILGIFIVLIIILIIATKKGSDKSIIKIGFIGAITGEVSGLGEAAKNAVMIAENEINSSGGINGRQIQIIYEDGKCSPASASSAAQKLLNIDRVVAIIGGLCSGETSAFIKPASDMKVPVISYCSSAPALSSSGKYFFRTYPSDAYQGKYAAEYAYNNLNARKVALLYHISDWGNGIKDVFTKRFIELGGEIVFSEGTSQDTRDYKTQLVKIKQLNPDYLYMPTYPEGSLVVVQQAIDLGLKTKILAADAWNDPKFISNVNKNADIVYVGTTGVANESFKEKYIAFAKTNEVPICAPQAYDAMTTLVGALREVGTDSIKLPDAIRAQKFYGVAGPVAFNENGDTINVEYVVKRILNNKAIEVK